MVKKILIILTLLIVLVGCSEKGQYIPTAAISNVEYIEDTLEVKFDLNITDKSSTISSAQIVLYHNDIIFDQITYDLDETRYTFCNIQSDSSYYISVLASYTLNASELNNKELLKFDLTNYTETKVPVFNSKTFKYTGEEFSIYLENVDNKYTVKYEGNGKKEVGEYTVIAEVYLDNKLISTHTATLVIVMVIPEIEVYNQSHYYTSNPINVVYSISSNSEVLITYNGTSEVPSEVGTYNVIIKTVSPVDTQETYKSITMNILPAKITLFATNKIVKYNSQEHSIDINTNLECTYTIKYNNSINKPINPGVYDVEVIVEDTNNYYGITKHLTLTILDENDTVEINELFISQFTFIEYNKIIIELYNPTQYDIILNDYSISIGDISNKKIINLDGFVIKSLSTFTIGSVDLDTKLEVDYKNSFLLSTNKEDIFLIHDDETIDLVKNNYTSPFNLIRQSFVGYPTIEFTFNEWYLDDNYENFYHNLNNHEYKYTELQNDSYIEVTYSNTNYINVGSVIDFNDYITIYDSTDGRIYITDDMIYTSNLNVNKIDTYIVTFLVQNSSGNSKRFTVNFTVSDLEGPKFNISSNSLVYNLGDQIDFLSLVEVTDYSDILSITYTDVEIATPGIYEIVYEASDVYKNKSTFKLIIFIL